MQHVFIIGAKSLGAYGGYETFIYKLIEYHKNNKKMKYHVACKANGSGCMNENMLSNVKHINHMEFEYNHAHCFKIKVPNVGSAQAILYDIKALQYCMHYIKENKINRPIIYILACRIGFFLKDYQRQIQRLGGFIYINPDGHEWMRAKWNLFIRKYWKESERWMVKYCDLVVCDSKNIQKYIEENYATYGVKTTYIAYGAEVSKSNLADDHSEYVKWLENKGLKRKGFYLAVGRFVPENNYETMIREFMSSNSVHDFAIITNVNRKFLQKLEKKLGFQKDKRIKLVGTVYDQQLLKKIREDAYGYFHGHEVGGTNPSLLEALGSTELNLLLNVNFNKEVAGDSALYWTKEKGSLKNLIEKADAMDEEEITYYGRKAKEKIISVYSWEHIVNQYEKVFLEKVGKV